MSTHGFTLVELLVGLTVSALLVLVAAGIFGATLDATEAMVRMSSRHDESAIARRWLDTALRGAIVSPSAGEGFSGDATSLDFHSAAQTPFGWSEPGRTAVWFQDGSLQMRRDRARPRVLLDSLAAASFAYRGRPGESDSWLPAWESFTEAPNAIRVILGHLREAPDDTLLVILNPRGG